LRTQEIIVSANKKVQTVQEVPVSVSTINLKELTERNITDIDKALEYIPGVNMTGSQVSIRGSSGFAFGLGSRVAYLLDGFPVLSGDQGDMKFDIIPIFNIERIEVVKGAGSALYGTGALGGIINIITENPDEEGALKIKAYSGFYTKPKYDEWIYSDDYSYNSGLDISYSKKISNFAFLVSSRVLKDDSYRLFDKRVNGNFFSKLNYSFGHNTNLTFSGSYAANSHDDWVYWHSLDSATIPPANADLDAKIYSEKGNINFTFNHIFESGDFIVVRSGIYRTFFENSLEEWEDDYRQSLAYSINNEVQMNKSLNRNMFLTSGLNYVHNKVDASVYGNKAENIAAAYTQLESRIKERFILTTGLRVDYEKTDSSDFNLEISPKIGILYKSPFGVNFRASVGKGFRAATLAEKFASINYGPFKVVPNTEIKPEENWSFEVGAGTEMDLSGSLFYIDLSLFQNEMRNMIEARFVEENLNPYIQFGNVTEARILGAEIDIRSFLFGFLGINTSLTLMDPKDITNPEKASDLKYRSKILWYNSLIIPIGMMEFQIDYRFMSRPENVDDRLDKFIADAGERINAHIVDGRLIFNMQELIDKDIKIIVNADNLLDYYYTSYPGNLAPTRKISLQIVAKF
jgi:outer membrane receptor for ferrienterochelin and colicins